MKDSNKDELKILKDILLRFQHSALHCSQRSDGTPTPLYKRLWIYEDEIKVFEKCLKEKK